MTWLRYPLNIVRQLNDSFRINCAYSRGGAFFVLGMLMLMLYAVSKEIAPQLSRIAEGFFIFTGMMIFLATRQIRSSIWGWMLAILIVIQLLSWASAMLSHPEWSSRLPPVDRLAKSLLFIPIGLLLAGSLRNALVLWCCFVLGLLLAIFSYSGGVAYWVSGFHGARLDFGIQNAAHPAMFFAVIFLVNITMVKDILFPYGSWQWGRTIVWLISSAISLLIVYFAQTRGVILGLLLSLGVVSCIWIVRHINVVFRRRNLFFIVPVVFVASVLGYKLFGIVEMRQASETNDITTMQKVGLASAPDSSIIIRLKLWTAAKDRILERPILGWGDKARNQTIQTADFIPQKIKDNFGHLHNLFLDIAVSYGFLGLLAYVLINAFALGQLYFAWKASVVSGSMLLLGIGFTVLWFFINCFESYGLFSSGVFTYAIVWGCLLTKVFLWRYPECFRKYGLDK